MSNPVYLALDLPQIEAAKELAGKVQGHIGGLKLGLEFFCAHGHHGVHEIAQLGLPIFLDLKLHDIPNTVAGAMQAIHVLNFIDTKWPWGVVSIINVSQIFTFKLEISD